MTVNAPTISGYADDMWDPYYLLSPAHPATDDMVEALAQSLRGQVIEGFRIHEAQVLRKLGAYLQSIVQVRVLLDDPADDEPLWPFAALDRAIQRRADDLGIEEDVLTWHVWLRDAIEAGFPAGIVERARGTTR